jgi:uncharacterized protein (TIGR02391 family)
LEITKVLPTAESVIQFEPEELAPYVLDHVAGNSNHLHLNNLLGSSIGGVTRHYNNDARVEQAVREAWSWLVREGLLVEKSNGWYFISRRGQRIKGRQDFAAFQRSNVLPKASLHPVIAEKVWSNFVRGDYETAVFQAFKEVEVAVRAAGKFPPTEIGTTLMGKAFKVRVGSLIDSTLPEAEQLAMVNLFSGAVGLFKNPSSHRHVVLSEPSEAAEMISFASLLMRIVDVRVAAVRDDVEQSGT